MRKTTAAAPAKFAAAPKTLAGVRRMLEARLKDIESAALVSPLNRGYMHGLSVALGMLEFVADGREGWTLEVVLERLHTELGNTRRAVLRETGANTNQRLLDEGIANGLEAAVELLTCFAGAKK